MTKRLISILMAIFMITAIAVPVANAAGDNTLDTTKKVSITMNCDKAGYEFEVFKIADLVTATNPYTVKYDVKVDDAAVKTAIADGNFEEADRGKILSALDKDAELTGATTVGKYSVDTDGKFIGKFKATGVRPKALEKIRGNGVSINYDWFTN